jgi:hypothetical protein
MKVRTRVVSLTVLCFALSALTFATDNSHLFIVHGIPGRDVAAHLDPTLPLDVLLNNDLCIERGITFGAMLGPLALAPGEYNLKVSQADLLVPCSGSPIAETNVSIVEDQNVSAVFALDEKGQPAIFSFANDLASVTQNNARIILTNTANAPELQITLQVVNSQQKYTYNVNPGKQVIASVPAGAYTIEVQANSTVLVPAQPLTLPSLSVNVVYAVGSASNGSLGLVTKTVKDVL